VVRIQAGEPNFLLLKTRSHGTHDFAKSLYFQVRISPGVSIMSGNVQPQLPDDLASSARPPLTVKRMFYRKAVKVAAYQPPLFEDGSMDPIELMQQRVRECEAGRVSVLCSSEAILGGLADFSDNPRRFAIRTDDGQLASVLAPLASETVTSIVGFTELGPGGTLYNAAAVFQRGRVAGLYRKIHPAIRRSVYIPGSETLVFREGELTFGIVICNDSNYPELARRIAAQGATALFIPTNNGLPNGRASLELNAAARSTDIAIATENQLWVIRADVAGRNRKLTCFGCSEIVDPQGNVVREARLEQAALLVADIEIDTAAANN
jgi:predicted amidohydrolase